MRQIVFMDPHTADFVYEPISFKVAGRRALRKYQYLADFFEGRMFFTMKNSSLPSSWQKKMPHWALSVLVFFELMIWSRMNFGSLKAPKVDDLDQYDVFLFGYKNARDALRYLADRGFRNRIYIHLSHYHTFEIDKDFFDCLDIVLCFDNDISDVGYFKYKFPFYERRIKVLPFQVSERFSCNIDDVLVTKRVAVSGTYHKLDESVLDIRCNGYSTLHPIRLEFSEVEELPDYVENKLSLYQSNSSVLNMLFKGQKKYFSFDIVDFYRNSTHAFIGCEGTGAVAIGTLEAMACGCIVYLHRDESKGLLFELEDADCELYENLDDLVDKLNKLDRKSYKKSAANALLAKRYSPKALRDRLDEVFSV